MTITAKDITIGRIIGDEECLFQENSETGEHLIVAARLVDSRGKDAETGLNRGHWVTFMSGPYSVLAENVDDMGLKK